MTQSQSDESSSKLTPALSAAFQTSRMHDIPTTREETITSGEQARSILESQAYQTAYQLTMNGLIESWGSTKPEEQELREMYWNQVQVIQDIAFNLATQVDLALAELAELEREQQNG